MPNVPVFCLKATDLTQYRSFDSMSATFRPIWQDYCNSNIVISAVLKWCKLSQSIRLRKTYKNVKTSTFDHVHWTNKVKNQFRNDNTLFDFDMLHYLRLKVRTFIQHSPNKWIKKVSRCGSKTQI